MVNPVIALFTGLVALLSLTMIFSRNPITSAFSLVGVMIGLGGIYAAVGAHFVAALQIIVYAGAVMVLFVFSIMLLNSNDDESEVFFKNWRHLVGLASALLLIGLFTWAFALWGAESRLPGVDIYDLTKIKAMGGNVLVLSALLFSQSYIQFELISLLLLVALAAALVLAKRKVD